MEWQDRLMGWTGFDYAIALQSGSAALELALDVLAMDAPVPVKVPAISCWTISGTLAGAGHQIVFEDVDGSLKVPASTYGKQDGFLRLVMEPWGLFNDHTVSGQPSVADLTLSVYGELPQGNYADYHNAAVISCGSGKPIDIGAGGILLLRSREDYLAAQERFFFGRNGLRWNRQGKRYVFSGHLHPALDRASGETASRKETCAQKRIDWQEGTHSYGIPLTMPAGESGEGVTELFPVLLPEGFPLRARDVYRVCVAERLPLLLQPVTPAYLQPAWGKKETSCECAETIADRLMFIPSRIHPDASLLERLKRMLDTLRDTPDTYVYPYAIKEAMVASLPGQFAHWERFGLVCRSMSGGFYVLDQLNGRLYQIPPAMAAYLQQNNRHDG